MSKDPESSEIGEVFQESYECETITWKISNVSILDITEDTEVRSPCFSYKKAVWILKIRPCAIRVYIERLHSEIPVHEFLYTIFFKSHKRFSDSNDYRPLNIHLNNKQEEVYWDDFELNWYSLFYHNSAYRCNDTITLIVKILIKKNAAVGLDSETKSPETTLGSEFIKNEDSLQSTGELLVESFHVDFVAWKIPKIHSIPVQVDNRVQSPMFSFDGASWILKLFLYGQARLKSERNVDVVIERLQSDIQKHPVIYDIGVKSDFENVSLINDCQSMLHKVLGFFIFDADHTQENVLRYQSYNNFLKIAGSNPQFGTISLINKFRSPKKSEILLNFQGTSLQPITNLPEVPRNSEKLEVGESIKKPFECEFISWRIPNFSSMLSSEDNEVQSPLFSYKGAIWNFKMFSYFHKNSEETGVIRIVMNRLHSQIPVHNVFFRFFFTDHFGNKLDGDGKYCVFNSFFEERDMFLNWPDTFYLYKKFRHNDTLTLTFEVYSKKNLDIETNFNTKSVEKNFGSRNTSNDDSCKSVGELFIESFDVEVVTWKIPKIRSFTEEVDKGVQSPSFSFAGASWILTMFPYGQTKFESQEKVDLAIDRVYSLFPNHPVTYKIFFKAYDKQFDKHGYSLEDFDNGIRENSFIFEASNARENICNVMSYIDLFSLVAPNPHCDTAFLVCDFRTKNNTCKRLNILSKSHQLDTGLSQSTSKEEPLALASSCKGSSQKSRKEKPAALFSGLSFKGHDDEPGESVKLPSKKFLSDMKELFFKQEDCDVILKVKEQEFPAHRLILKARSPVFASTFKNDTKEKATGVIDIEDCDPSFFSDFLYFLYCGTAEKLSSKNVFSLFTAADKYDVQDLRSECMKFMKINLSIDNLCDTIVLALKHSEKELIKLTTVFFRKNLRKIILTAKWQSFLIENPIQGNELLIKALSLNKT